MATTSYTKKPKYATAKVVQSQIEHWAQTDPSVLRCRSVWHAWEDYTVIDNGKERAEVLRCQRGHGFKYRVLNSRTGAVIHPWTPILPKHYYMPKGAGRISRQAMNYVRLAAIEATGIPVTTAAGNIFDLVHAAMAGDGDA